MAQAVMADGGGTPKKSNTSILSGGILGETYRSMVPTLNKYAAEKAAADAAAKAAAAKKPTVVKPYNGPLNNTVAPYIPGYVAPKGTTTTTNKTYFPSADGKGSYDSKGGVIPTKAQLKPGVNVKAIEEPAGGYGYGPVKPKTNTSIVAAPTQTVTPTSDPESFLPSGGGGGSIDFGNYTQGTAKPELMSGKSMAELLGVVYDRAEMERTLTDAAKAKYANLDNEYGRTQDHFYDSVAAGANAMMGTLRRGDREAAMSGTARGTQAAQQMNALLLTGEQNALGATELAQGRSDLIKLREAEIAEASAQALKNYNELGLSMGDRITSAHNANMVGYTADQGRASSQNAALLAAEAQRIAANKSLEGAKYAADKGLEGSNAYAAAQVASAKASGSGGSTYNTGYQPSEKDQQAANILAAINSGKFTKDELAPYIKKYNELMGIPQEVKPNNVNLFQPNTNANANRPGSARPNR